MIDLDGETTETRPEIVDRATFIGGSDIAAVMGLSRWSTPLRLYCEKTGKIPPKDLSEVEAVQLGIELEDNVARWWARTTGYKVRRDNRSFTHPQYPYMKAHIDRWVIGDDSLLECKTTSAWNVKEWMDEEIPQEYVLQVNWYLGLVGKKIGHLACMIGGQKRVKTSIEFNQDLFDKQVESAKTFWEDYVECDIAPIAMADDNETLKFLFPESKDKEEAALTQEQAVQLDALVEERQGGVEAKEEVEKELSRIENQIKQLIGEAESASTDSYTVTWKTQKREDPDREKMKQAGIFEEYSKTSSFRVLRTKKRKPSK